MKKSILIIIYILICSIAHPQGYKFKPVNRIPVENDQPLLTNNIKNASGEELRTGTEKPDSGCFVFNKLTNISMPEKIEVDTTIVHVVSTDGAPVYIKKKRTGLRSATMMTGEILIRDFFGNTQSLNITDPGKQIRIINTSADEQGVTHVKGEQVLNGIPVYGTEFTLHVSVSDERFLGKTADTSLIDADSVRISESTAIEIVSNDLRQKTTVTELNSFGKKLLEYERPGIDTIYYPNADGRFRLCFKINIRPNLVEEWIYYVDAVSGEIIFGYNNTKTDGPTTTTAIDNMGRQRTFGTFLENGVYYMVDASKSMYNASTGSGIIATYDMNYSNTTGNLITSPDNRWNNSVSVSAHANAAMVYDYLKNTFNRNSYDNKGSDMLCMINLGDKNGNPENNAYWGGKLTFFGGGTEIYKPIARSIDAVGHEFGHGVVQTTADLEYLNQSGAINETYADIFGAMVKRTNWKIGDDAVQLAYFPSGAMRDMSDPHNGGPGQNGWQPAHASEMYIGTDDNGGVHINSGIGNFAYYKYATAASKEKAEQVFYKALTEYLTKTSKFTDFRIAAVQAAKDLYGETDANLVATAFDQVGITESGGVSGSGPGELQPTPGKEFMLFNAYNYAKSSYTLYRSDLTSIYEVVSSKQALTRPSVSDNGVAAVFVGADKYVYYMNLNTGQIQSVFNQAGFAGAAVSKDGNRIAAVTENQDACIYVLDLTGLPGNNLAGFKLYNPTTGTGGAVNNSVMFAEAIEFDHTGEYLMYDAYNKLSSGSGKSVDYWDIGLIEVWNNQTNTFGSGKIMKPFGTLPEGMSLGNPVYSKNSPNIIAFDYYDGNSYATFAADLNVGKLNVLFTNDMPSFPSFGINDNNMAFTFKGTDSYSHIGRVNLNPDKMSTVNGTAIQLFQYAYFPVYYGTGNRVLGLKPVPAFMVDVKEGISPLSVQFQDLSTNKPTSWIWTFEGGIPGTSTLQHPKITYNTPGNYKVKLTVSNEYGTETEEKQAFIQVTATSVSVTEKPVFSVFPNPANDIIHVRGLNNIAGNMTLSDVFGKNISVTVVRGNSDVQIDISYLPKGIYFLRTEEGTAKIIKK
jgi:Zn-dependent metalloprotease/PKD repeat protein